MNQIQRRPVDKIAGSYRRPEDVNARMQEAMASCHLIAPATSAGRLQEGCSVFMSVVKVDIQNETYDVGAGKRGLSKTVLEKLGSAMGVSWDPVLSQRLDDGSNPAYVLFRAVGTFRNFDGQVQTIVGTKEMDLRPNSPQVQALEERARAKNRSADPQVREMKLHIVAHAESKARLRALRSIGIRAAYTVEELQKPFVAAKVAFTGETDSPELRRYFAERTADAFLGSTSTLYGRSGGQLLSAGQPRVAPPPLQCVGDEDFGDDDFYEPENEPAQQRQAAPEQKTQAKPAHTSTDAQTGARAQPRSSGGKSGLVMPFGRSKDMAIEDAPTNDIEWMANHVQGRLDAGESRFPDKDQALLDALLAEIARREGGAQQPAGDKF